jgi:hypothetical protein
MEHMESASFERVRSLANVIINCLRWTNSRYQVGRLIRIGQKMDSVKVIIVKASLKLGTKRYEYEIRKNGIQ